MNVMTKCGQKDNIITYEHICDSIIDVTNIPSDQITLGSTCIVLNGENNGLEIYMADSQKKWQPLTIFNNENNNNNNEEISNIFNITNPQNGDTLVYNNVIEKWVNKAEETSITELVNNAAAFADAAAASANAAANSAEQAMSGTPEGYAALVAKINEINELTYNLFDINNATIITGYIRANGTNSDLVATYQSGTPTPCKTFVISVEAGKTYTFSRKAGTRLACGCDTEINTANHTLQGGSFYTQAGNSVTHVTITIPSECSYLYVWFYNESTDTSYDATCEEAMLTEGSEVLPFVEYGQHIVIHEEKLDEALQMKIDNSFLNRQIVAAGTDLETILTPGSYLLVDGGNYVHSPVTTGMLSVVKHDNWTLQTLYELYPNIGNIYIQSIRQNGVVAQSWIKIESDKNKGIIPTETDLKDLKAGCYLKMGSGSEYTYINEPFQNAGLITITEFDRWKLQTAVNINTAENYIQIINQSGNIFKSWHLVNNFGVIPSGTNLNDLSNGNYLKMASGSDYTYINEPFAQAAFISVEKFAAWKIQKATAIVNPYKVFTQIIRGDGVVTTSWNDCTFNNKGILDTNTDLNTVVKHGTYLLMGQNTYTNCPINGQAGIMTVFRADTYWMYQTITSISQQKYNMYIRVMNTSGRVMYGWINTADAANHGILASNIDLNSVTDTGSYLLLSTNTYTNKPTNINSAILLVFKSDLRWTIQMLIPIGVSENILYLRHLFLNQPRTNWTTLSGENNYYTITQQINRDTITNNYTSTISPTIITDANGWLQPTGDQTDMSPAIMAMLTQTGYCHLAPGTYYVIGNIDMPDGSAIEGCGETTVLRLLDNVSSGYVIQVKNHSTVRSIKFSGGDSAPTDLYTDGTTYGSRHGIVYIGNRDGQETVYAGTRQSSVIENCWFENFDGSGIYGRNVGGGINQGLRVARCDIRYCRVGINLDYYVEYSTFSECLTFNCHWGCINNGGNNLFTTCIFHGVVGWMLDNSNSDKGNNSHGSCVGCTFNHIDNMQRPSTLGGGLAVHIINGDHGYTFTGCQFWYGNISIENSQGIIFSNSLFGNSAVEIEVTGNYPAFFFGNIFKNAPTVLNVNGSTKFTDNWTMTGNAVVP